MKVLRKIIATAPPPAPAVPAGAPQPAARAAVIEVHEFAMLERLELEERARALAHAIYLGDGEVLCRILGRFKLYVPTSDIGFGAHVMMEGIWEGWLNPVVARLVQPGMTTVDVGANHGYYTVLLGGLVGPAGRVFALEPNPATATLLRRSIEVNGMSAWAQVIEAAASDEAGQALPFYVEPHEPKNARLAPASSADDPRVILVPSTTLDVALADTPRVDFIKIDVEGAEEAALAGAMGIIGRDRPDVLLEFNAPRCADPADLLDRLEALYGEIFVIDYASRLERADRARLLNPAHREDWSLLLTARRGDDLPIAMA